MNVATITLEYTGRSWHARCITDPAARPLGVGHWRGARVVLPGPAVVLDADSAFDLREELVELIKDLVSNLTMDILDQARSSQSPLFDALPKGPLAP